MSSHFKELSTKRKYFNFITLNLSIAEIVFVKIGHFDAIFKMFNFDIFHLMCRGL